MLLAIPYFFSLWELAASFRIKREMNTKQKNIQETDNFDTTIIVSAYLPNEQDVILHTIKHILMNVNCPGNLQIILAYNTPKNLPVENELKRLSDRDERFEVLRVDGSSRKAANMNAAIQFASGQMIAFFDADAKPGPDCLIKAHRWLRRGYDFVQGANLVQNRKDSWISKIVFIEFLEKYFVSYLGRFLGADVTYFTGSNAYWRSSVLKELVFPTSIQVEDISGSIYCMLRGNRLAFDPDIHCYELAPVRFVDWWKQRKRWAIGWSELTKRFQAEVLSSSKLDLLQKVVWTYFLTGRRIILPVLQYVVIVIAVSILFSGPIWFFVGLNSVLSALGIAVSFAQGLAVRRMMSYSGYLGLGPLFAYALFFPVYDSLRNLTILRGVSAFFLKETKWEVTSRIKQPFLAE
jgi:cellulose synthase/poly-beta-1,6-N-acetylglucosamine synthase-like glycosyltransferase